MYESSSLTIAYKYLFVPAWGVLMLTGLFFPADDPGKSSNDDFIPALIVFTAVMIWLIILSVRLRRVVANGSHLTIRSFHRDTRIDYKNIEYVSEAALLNPRLITVKYVEPETGESDIIFIIPSTTSEMFRFKFLQEHDMTQYIREQIFIHNPNYSTENEPSRWRVWGLLVLTISGTALFVSCLSLLLEQH